MDRKTFSNLGIHVYGLGAIVLGVVGLVWGDFADVWQPVPSSIPYRKALAYVVAFCFVAAGTMVQWRRFAQFGLMLLGIFYFIFGLLWLPRVIRLPYVFDTWGGVFEQFSLVAPALILYGLLVSRDSPRTLTVARAGRLLFGICAIAFGLNHFFAIPITASMVPKWIPGHYFWAVATGVFHLLAGIAILSGIMASLASRLLTSMIFLFGALVWVPAIFSAPHQHVVWAGNAINLAICGASWVVADAINTCSEQLFPNRDMPLEASVSVVGTR